ncbi:AGE family epimerase/isomerase [Laedolimicola sp.]|uniref:AGE family epimerase/isomerase n=1 Tax=Laedolimicola sp. TaxID=2981663 RepID=UPI003F7E3A3A
MAATEKKYQLGTTENQEFLREVRNGLLNFGHLFPSTGGSSYYLGDDGTPWKDRNRETWITSRMAHVYSIGSILGHEGSEALADAALKGLRGELHDDRNGGWYAGLTRENKIVPTKQCYAHAFVILAVADVTEDENYRIRAGRIIDHVLVWAKDNHWRIPEHFSSDWVPDLECNKERPDDPFKPYGATPGHGIEWARLITQWALSTYKGDKNGAALYREAAENLYNRAVEDAWNTDGAPGIVYTTDWNGKPLVHDRMHWTLAEAINTSAVLYRVTENEKYAVDYAEFMKYLDEKVLDHVHGSWFRQLDRENHLLETVWPGKSDIYHALQATLIPYYAPGLSIAVAVKKSL